VGIPYFFISKKEFFMNLKKIVFVGLTALSANAYCEVSEAYFQVIQMHAQTEACTQKFPESKMSDAFKKWQGRNEAKNQEILKDVNFQQRKKEMVTNMVNSKRFVAESCGELKKLLNSKESDVK
jgi:hypothetical protein